MLTPVKGRTTLEGFSLTKRFFIRSKELGFKKKTFKPIWGFLALLHVYLSFFRITPTASDLLIVHCNLTLSVVVTVS